MKQPDRTVRAALAMLGLDQDADRGEVIRAYRRLAKANHPDVSNAPDATERFTTITAAYRRVMETAPQPPGPAASPETWTGPSTLFPRFDVARRPTPLFVAGPVHIEPARRRPPTAGTGGSPAGGGT